MKKRLIISIVFFILLTFVIVVFLISVTRDDVFHVTTVKKSYNIVSTYDEEVEELNIPIYVSDKKAYVVNKEKISSSYISSKEDDERLNIDVVDITDKNITREIKGKKYFLYNYRFIVKMKVDSQFTLSLAEAVLNIEYASYEQGLIKVDIGTFDYNKIPSSGDIKSNLLISKIKPVVNFVGKNKSLVGISLTLTNISNNEMSLVDFEMLNSSVVVSKTEVKEIKNNFNSSDDISHIIGYKYSYTIVNEDGGLNGLVLNKNESKEYLFPLKYKNQITVDNIGFIIEYEINNERVKVYYDDFTYFNDNNEVITDNDFVINTYENC